MAIDDKPRNRILLIERPRLFLDLARPASGIFPFVFASVGLLAQLQSSNIAKPIEDKIEMGGLDRSTGNRMERLIIREENRATP